MNFVWTSNGLRIGKDSADRKVRKDSTVVFKALKCLNAGDYRRPWRRVYPDRIGLTSCRVGIRNMLTGDIYWHERYAIESASEAFNDGSLFLLKG